METINFVKDERVKELSYGDLCQTLTLYDSNKKLTTSRPVEHFQFIDNIKTILDKKGISYTLEPVIVSKSDSNFLPAIDPERKGLLKAWLFQRLVTKLNIVDLANMDNNPSIVIGYNVHGLNCAFGLNVNICQNMSIFGSNYMTTYGNNKLPFDKMMEVITKWSYELPQMTERDRIIFNKLIETPSMPMPELIGNLQLMAVKDAYLDSSTDAPLNISQVSQFSKKVLEYKKEGKELNNMFEVYNFGTEILSPKSSEIMDVWQKNQRFGNYILDYCNIELN